MHPTDEALVKEGPNTIKVSASEQSHVEGVWTLDGDTLIIDEPRGPATILLPSERVRLLAIALPLSSHAKRIAALPYALEDQVAESMEQVHLALGEVIAPKTYLIGVVSHAQMQSWIGVAAQAGLSNARFVPDVLMVPVPGDGAWAVKADAARALVRESDGTGFALPSHMLHAAWLSAGKPAVVSYGVALPTAMNAVTADAAFDHKAALPLDLRQGAYARKSGQAGKFWKQLGVILGLGVIAHVAIAGADLFMLQTIAADRKAQLQAAVHQAAPNVTLGAEPVAQLGDMLPGGEGAVPVAGDGVLMLLNRTSAALAPMAGGITTQAVRFEAGKLHFAVEGGGADLRSRIETALKGAGLRADMADESDGQIRFTVEGA